MTMESRDHGEYSEVFEEGVDAGNARTVHRLRANSSILQFKKILGEMVLNCYEITFWARLTLVSFGCSRE